MACCAIAVFILSQLYVGFAAVRELLFGRSPELDAASVHSAAAWRPGAPAPAIPRRAVSNVLRLTGPRAAGALAAGLVSVTVLALLARQPDAVHHIQAICGRLLP